MPFLLLFPREAAVSATKAIRLTYLPVKSDFRTIMKKKPRVYQEKAKIRHTAHWDWDYLSWEEIERRLKEAGVGPYRKAANGGKKFATQRSAYGIWIGIGLLILAAVLSVLILR